VITSENTEPSPCQTVDGVLVQAPAYETVMTGAVLREAHVETNNFDQPLIAFTLQPDQKDFFAEYTREHQGDFLTIVLDKQVISSPRIQSVIDSGQGTITGQFTLEEAQKLALQLRFGSLPVPLRIESTRQVGATLGAQSVESSIRAGAIGVLIVLLFMLLYYRLPGVMADIALIFYMLLNFAIFEALPVTLTLPAITGFLLSTGMAVDANVLIFERLKEELGKNAGIKQAVDTGFSKAWISIRDSNVATLVICMVLWMFGRSFGASAVQGFALTLAIGVLVSMFTAVIVTRSLVKLVIGGTAKRLQKHIWLLGA
jgi:protein-export membrane protein SecD